MDSARKVLALMSRVAALGAVALAFSGVALAWTGPTGSPPANNVSAPINVSGTAQTKSGALTINGLLSALGNITAPIVTATSQFCLAGTCISTWPSGGGGGGTDTLQSVTSRGNTTGLDIRVPIIYDINNTGFYVDPNSTSNFYNICLSGDCRTVWPTAGSAFTDTDTLQSVTTRGATTNQNIQVPFIYDINNTGYYLDPNGTSRMNEIQADRVYGFADIRSPIFYDYNNTGYYLDPNGTSNLNTVYTNDVYIGAVGRWASSIANGGASYYQAAANYVTCAPGYAATQVVVNKNGSSSYVYVGLTCQQF